MSMSYFVRRNGVEEGPFSARDLHAFVRAGTLRPEDLIRKADSAHWIAASRVQGLWPSRPPAPVPAPSAPPISQAIGSDRPPPMVETLDVPALAEAQRWVIRSLLLTTLAFVLWPLLILVIPFQIYCIARLVRLLNWEAVPVAAAITGTLIPYIGLIPLLIANQAASRVLRQAGYAIGFLGARSTAHTANHMSA